MTTWRKSSYSGSTSTQSDCIEVTGLAGGIGIRDSKAPNTGHLTLTLTPQAFATLIHHVKHDKPIR